MKNKGAMTVLRNYDWQNLQYRTIIYYKKSNYKKATVKSHKNQFKTIPKSSNMNTTTVD